MHTIDEFIDEAEDLAPSKTKLKEQMEDLQVLGVKLVHLNKERLAKFALPDSLVEAIKLAQTITSNGALRRQYQYIGKLMRNVDADYIKNRLAEVTSDSVHTTKLLHLAERWRDLVLSSDGELHKFITEYAVQEISDFRTLVRSVRREQQLQHKRNYRKLFQVIRSIIQAEK